MDTESWIVAQYCCGEYNVQRFTNHADALDYYGKARIDSDNDRFVYLAKVESDNRQAVLAKSEKWIEENLR